MEQAHNDNNFEQCIKCTVCTVYCPLATVNSNYSGPKQAGPDGERYRLKNPSFYDPSLEYCLNCKRCEVACPSDVKIGDIIQRARIKYSKKRPHLREFLLASTDLMGRLATTFTPLTNHMLKWKTTKAALEIIGIDHRRTFPAYSRHNFTSWFRVRTWQKNYKRYVTYFHGCYVNYNNPKLGKDFVRVMNALNYGVHLLDKEKCCGVALIANGFIEKARRNGIINLRSMRAAIQKKEPVLATSSTCVFTIRDEYPNLLNLSNEDIRGNILLATKFIYEQIDNGKLKLAFKPDYHKCIAYHTPCHMEKLGWSIYSISLLRMIPGVDLIVLDSQCCGIAGTYGFKKENYQYSQKIGDDLFRQINNLPIDLVATDCETCKWQIEMSTKAKVENPISILAEALDLEETLKLNKLKK